MVRFLNIPNPSRTARVIEMVELICDQCGEPYESKTESDYIDLCSEKCRKEWRVEAEGLIGMVD